MKRSIALIFLLIIFLNVSGTYVFFAVRIVRIYAQRREELKSALPSNTQCFEFSESELRNVRVNRREIKVDGKMFDITHVVKENGKFLVYCIHDEAEDDLFSFLDDVLKKAAKDQRMARAVTSWFSSNFQQLATIGNNPYSIIQSNTGYHHMTSEKSTRIISPPPKG